MSTSAAASDQVVLCAVQDSPVSFDLEKTLDKVEALTADAAEIARSQHGNDAPIIVVFPEAFVSAYPRGMDFGAVIGSRTPEGRSWYGRYHASSVPVSDVAGPAMSRLRRAASANKVTLVVGVIERCDGPVTGQARESYGSAAAGGHGTLYCSALTIGPDGTLLSNHRKLQPTASERLVWGQGDGAGVRVVSTPVGKVGATICWENYMPLARMALYQQGVEVYTAPTADTRDTWTSSMRHIAAEGRCFVISCCQFNVRSDFPEDYPAFKDKQPSDIVTRGGSVICGPLGEVIAGPLLDKAGILCVAVRRSELAEARMDFDPTGHYARSDVFSLKVNRSSNEAVTFSA